MGFIRGGLQPIFFCYFAPLAEYFGSSHNEQGGQNKSLVMTGINLISTRILVTKAVLTTQSKKISEHADLIRLNSPNEVQN